MAGTLPPPDDRPLEPRQRAGETQGAVELTTDHLPLIDDSARSRVTFARSRAESLIVPARPPPVSLRSI